MTDLNYFENVYNNLPNINISFVVPIFSLVMYWLLFEKAGENGWKILIPYYSEYIIFKIAKKAKLFWWQLTINIVTIFTSLVLVGILIYMFNSAEEVVGMIIGCIAIGLFLIIASIALIVIQVKRSIGLAKAFGQTTAFGIGILFLEPIFIAIIALSKDVHHVSEENVSVYGCLGYDENNYVCENQF